MFKKTKNFLVLVLLAVTTIAWAHKARAGQENLGEIVDASVNAQESPMQECFESPEQLVFAGDQKEKEEGAQHESGALEFENGSQALKVAGINFGILAVLLRVLHQAAMVPHELGHAFATSTLFPGALDRVTFLPGVSPSGNTYAGHFWCNEKSKSDPLGATFGYKTKWSLVCLAGPIAGIIAANRVSKLSKHKKCPQVLKWPLRAVSCLLPVLLMEDLLPIGTKDGGQIYEQWAGNCEPSIRKITCLAHGLASAGLLCGLIHKEFPQFFRQLNESMLD